MSEFCKGQNCPIAQDCRRFVSYWRQPIGTKFWWGIAHGSCPHFLPKEEEPDEN